MSTYDDKIDRTVSEAEALNQFNPDCAVCSGTGWDPDFQSTCTECWGFVPRTRQGWSDRPSYRTIDTPEEAKRAVQARYGRDDDWKRLPRWKKLPGERNFVVVIPKGYTAQQADGQTRRPRTGDTVLVRNSAGQEKPVVLGAPLDTDDWGSTLYWPDWDAQRGPAERQTTGVRLAEGFYLLDDQVYRVVQGRNGRYAKVLIGTRFEYEAGAIKRLRPEHAVTAEVAAAFGHRTHHCLFCGRELDNPESIARGIGPVCFAKYC